MKALININLENDAFADELATELGRILRDLADQIESTGVFSMALRDSNGKTVGTFITTA